MMNVKTNLKYGMCQVFLGHVFIPGFSALYFCTLFTGYRAVACYPRFLRYVLQTKNLTKKSRKNYLKLLANFPNADECAMYKLIEPCLTPIECCVDCLKYSDIRTVRLTSRCFFLLLFCVVKYMSFYVSLYYITFSYIFAFANIC